MKDKGHVYKAIETVHSGWKFRSRLEARWAVFFETLGIEYRYEQEGFELGDGMRYLPDFYLPRYSYWIEIKPQLPTKQEREKAIRLCLATQKTVLLLSGDVWTTVEIQAFLHLPSKLCKWVETLIPHEDIAVYNLSQDEFIVSYAYGHIVGIDYDREYAWATAMWMECEQCHQIDVSPLGDTICSCKQSARYSYKSDRLMSAYRAARQARFEHKVGSEGEK